MNRRTARIVVAVVAALALCSVVAYTARTLYRTASLAETRGAPPSSPGDTVVSANAVELEDQ